MTARILIIAGSDSGGGAGIQADIKTVTMLGGHAMTAITAITAQNTLGVQAVHPVPTEMVIAQIDAVVSDIGVDAVKIGMIGSAETAAAVADYLETSFRRRPESLVNSDPGLRRGDDVPIIFDPVMVATSGAALADEGAIAAFQKLMRIATLTTPNLPELAALGGEAALTGPALIKGGHGEGDIITDRLVEGGREIARWTGERIETTSTHGTGCTLASAIACLLGQQNEVKLDQAPVIASGAKQSSPAAGTGLLRSARNDGLTDAEVELVEAIARARVFVRLALRGAPGLGRGHGPMGQQSVRLDHGAGLRLNQVTVGLSDYPASRAFYQALGLRLIVDSPDNGYARFETGGGATFSIHQLEAHSAPGGTTVYFECDDLDAEVARLRAAGFVFDSAPTDQSWLWRDAALRDPFGNRILLYQAGENRRYPPWRV